MQFARNKVLFSSRHVHFWATIHNCCKKGKKWPPRTFIPVKYISFKGLFIVALTCEVLSRLSLVFLFWEWYFTDIFETQQSKMRFFLIHGRHLSGRVQCSHRATTAMWTTMSSGTPIYHERHLSGRVQCSHRATAVSNVVTGPLPTISIMKPGNPI